MVPGGIVTGVVAACDPLLASAGTGRSASVTSAASSVLLTDSRKRVTDSTEAPAPVFFVVSATITVAPAPETAGAENALTVRSGPMRTVA